MDTVFLYIIGTAGSGKSTLTAAFGDWMTMEGMECMRVNLDPGAEQLPYQPDLDIRDELKLSDVMSEYGLGPNGAQVVAADLMYLSLGPIKEAISEVQEGYVLMDAPGQMELFTFRQSSRQIIDALHPERSAILFLMDPFLSSTPVGFTTLQMLAATTKFRFNIPMTYALTKIDILDEDKMTEILAWSADPNMLYDSMLMETPSMEKEMGVSTFRMLEDMNPGGRMIPLSSQDMYGMADVYDFMQELFMGGEDIQTGFR